MDWNRAVDFAQRFGQSGDIPLPFTAAGNFIVKLFSIVNAG
jgi:hypothetical protein